MEVLYLSRPRRASGRRGEPVGGYKKIWNGHVRKRWRWPCITVRNAMDRDCALEVKELVWHAIACYGLSFAYAMTAYCAAQRKRSTSAAFRSSRIWGKIVPAPGDENTKNI